MIGKDYPDVETPDPHEDEAKAEAKAQLLSLVRSGSWLDQQVFPPTRWAVPDLIPQGFGLFTGPPKAGKSWAVLNIALALAAGGRALGRIEVGPPRPVLYLALEDGDARLQERSRHLLEGSPIPPLFHETTEASPLQVIPLIQAWLDQHAGDHPLVVLDTLGKVMPPAKPGEGAYQRDYRVGGTLKRTIDAHRGSTLLVVHHVRKGAADDWMDSTSGTNGLNGSADFTVNLKRPRKSETGVLNVTGRDVVENQYAVSCNQMRWTIEGKDLTAAAELAEQREVMENLGERSAEIVEYVQHRGSAKPSQVAEDLGIKDARRYLARLAESGRLQKVGFGLYASVPPVPVSQDTPTTAVPPVPVSQQSDTPESLGMSQGVHGTTGTGTQLPLEAS